MEPTTRPKTTPKDFFLYLAAAITLYVSAGSLLALLFGIINAALPDRLDAVYYGSFLSGGIRFAIASLIIIFPLYLFLSWRIRKDIVGSPDKANIAIRRWFIFFTLFIAGGAMVGDLIALINTFLGGEITARFIFKVLAVFAVAGAVFWYYLYDLRRTDRGDMTIKKSFMWIAAIAVLASIVGGFVVMGSPMEQRSLRFDEERVRDLQEIQWQIVNHWQTKEELPADLSALEDSISGFRAPADPETDIPYRYSVKGPLSFELCATFDRETPFDSPSYPREFYPGAMEENWAHGMGEICFDRTIDPELYPPYKEPF